MAEKEEKIPSEVREKIKRGKEIESKIKEALKEATIYKEKKLGLKEKKRIEGYERNIMKGEGPYQHIKKEKMLGGKGWVRFHPSKAKMRKKVEEEKE
jgi:hypothetical protein